MKLSIILIFVLLTLVFNSRIMILRNTSESNSNSKVMRGKTYLQLTSVSNLNLKRKGNEDKYLYHKESVLDLELLNNPKIEDDKLGLVFEIKDYAEILNQIMIKYSDKTKKDYYYMPYRYIEECECKSIDNKLFIQCFLLNDNLEQYTWRLSLPLSNGDTCPEQSIQIVNQINTNSKLIKSEITKILTQLKSKLSEILNKKKLIKESEIKEFDRQKSINQIKSKNDELNKKKTEISKKMEESSTDLLGLQTKISEIEKIKSTNEFNHKVSSEEIISLDKSIELLKINDIKQLADKYGNELQGDYASTNLLFDKLKKQIPYKKSNIESAQKGLEQKNINPVNDFLYSVLERVNLRK